MIKFKNTLYPTRPREAAKPSLLVNINAVLSRHLLLQEGSIVGPIDDQDNDHDSNRISSQTLDASELQFMVHPDSSRLQMVTHEWVGHTVRDRIRKVCLDVLCKTVGYRHLNISREQRKEIRAWVKRYYPGRIRKRA